MLFKKTMIENTAFKIIFTAILSLLLGLSVLSQYDSENGKRNFPSSDQKYLPYFPSFVLPIIILGFPIILLFPLYKIGTLGAGDLKLFSILGFYFTFFETFF